MPVPAAWADWYFSVDTMSTTPTCCCALALVPVEEPPPDDPEPEPLPPEPGKPGICGICGNCGNWGSCGSWPPDEPGRVIPPFGDIADADGVPLVVDPGAATAMPTTVAAAAMAAIPDAT